MYTYNMMFLSKALKKHDETSYIHLLMKVCQTLGVVSNKSHFCTQAVASDAKYQYRI